jgi:hypothetical protein
MPDWKKSKPTSVRLTPRCPQTRAVRKPGGLVKFVCLRTDQVYVCLHEGRTRTMHRLAIDPLHNGPCRMRRMDSGPLLGGSISPLQ